MPIRGIILLVIFAIIFSWIFRKEIYAWIKKQENQEKNNDKKDNEEE